MPKIPKEKGLKAARHFGQEAECNRLSIVDYMEDVAIKLGFNKH